MLNHSRITLAILVGLTMAAPAFPADPVSPDELRVQFNWHVAFGQGSPASGYGLALGYRAQADAPETRLLQLDVDDAGAMARLAGLPIAEHSFRADAVAEDSWHASTTADKPWYARSWVYWTLGGLAATAALSSAGGGSSGHDDCGDRCNSNVASADNTGGGTSVCGTQGVNGVPDSCVGVPHFASLEAAARWNVVGSDAMDAGTGGMGDLIAR